MTNKKILFLVSGSILFLSFFTTQITIAAGTEATEFCKMIARIGSISWNVGGAIIIIGWIIAGVLYLTAGGGERMGIAKKALIAAVIGTVVVVLSMSASTIIIDALGTGGTGLCKQK